MLVLRRIILLRIHCGILCCICHIHMCSFRCWPMPCLTHVIPKEGSQDSFGICTVQLQGSCFKFSIVYFHFSGISFKTHPKYLKLIHSPTKPGETSLKLNQVLLFGTHGQWPSVPFVVVMSPKAPWIWGGLLLLFFWLGKARETWDPKKKVFRWDFFGSVFCAFKTFLFVWRSKAESLFFFKDSINDCWHRHQKYPPGN